MMYSNSMQEKLCFNKRFSYIVIVLLALILFVISANSLSHQQTSTNSRAEAAQSIPFLQVTRAPTHTPTCNTKNSVLVKDKEENLWSWASVATTEKVTNKLLCKSEMIAGSTIHLPLPRLLPSSILIMLKNPQLTEYYYLVPAKNGALAAYGNLIPGQCMRYGVEINITTETAVDPLGKYDVDGVTEPLFQIPSLLVGFPESSNEKCISSLNITCNNREVKYKNVHIADKCLNLLARKCEVISDANLKAYSSTNLLGKRGCCSTNTCQNSETLDNILRLP